VITSDIPGCREAVVDGESGLLCAVQNREAVYAAMQKLLALSADQRTAMGQRGRKLMEERFEKGLVVEETIRIVLR